MIIGFITYLLFTVCDSAGCNICNLHATQWSLTHIALNWAQLARNKQQPSNKEKNIANFNIFKVPRKKEKIQGVFSELCC